MLINIGIGFLLGVISSLATTRQRRRAWKKQMKATANWVQQPKEAASDA